jgi:hypothetical protein
MRVIICAKVIYSIMNVCDVEVERNYEIKAQNKRDYSNEFHTVLLCLIICYT